MGAKGTQSIKSNQDSLRIIKPLWLTSFQNQGDFMWDLCAGNPGAFSTWRASLPAIPTSGPIVYEQCTEIQTFSLLMLEMHYKDCNCPFICFFVGPFFLRIPLCSSLFLKTTKLHQARTAAVLLQFGIQKRFWVLQGLWAV